MNQRVLSASLLVLCLCLGPAHAGVDVNSASASDLGQVRHIDKSLSQRLVRERLRHGDYRDWQDLVRRVKGLDPQKLSDGGLLVQGSTYTGATSSGESPAQAAPPGPSQAVGGQPTQGKDAANTPMSPPTLGAPAPAEPDRAAAPQQ